MKEKGLSSLHLSPAASTDSDLPPFFHTNHPFSLEILMGGEGGDGGRDGREKCIVLFFFVFWFCFLLTCTLCKVELSCTDCKM